MRAKKLIVFRSGDFLLYKRRYTNPNYRKQNTSTPSGNNLFICTWAIKIVGQNCYYIKENEKWYHTTYTSTFEGWPEWWKRALFLIGKGESQGDISHNISDYSRFVRKYFSSMRTCVPGSDDSCTSEKQPGRYILFAWSMPERVFTRKPSIWNYFSRQPFYAAVTSSSTSCDILACKHYSLYTSRGRCGA